MSDVETGGAPATDNPDSFGYMEDAYNDGNDDAEAVLNEIDSIASEIVGGDSPDAGGAETVTTASDAPAGPAGNPRFYSIEYYKPYFDFTTAEITQRLVRSLNPLKGPFFGEGERRPDLYGPFWLATSLLILMCTVGNMASYFSTGGGDSGWIVKFSIGASVLYPMIFIMPLVVRCFMQRLPSADENDGDAVGRIISINARPPSTYVQSVCLYGYSLSWYVPVCILCVIPVDILRWLVISWAFFVSTGFLLFNVRPPVGGKAGWGLGILMILVNLTLAGVMKLYFFHYSS